MPKAPKPADVPDKVLGIAPELWRATHDPTISEHAAGRFFLSWNGGSVRIAFGHTGHPLDNAGSYAPPRFELAVSMAPALALELRNSLDKFIRQSQANAAAVSKAPSPTKGESPPGNGQAGPQKEG
jgi:hypothetical protein